GDLVDSNDRPRRADQLSREECDIAGTAADIEHSHALRESRRLEKAARDRLEKARLIPQTGDFPVRMAEHIGWVLHVRAAGSAARRSTPDSLPARSFPS